MALPFLLGAMASVIGVPVVATAVAAVGAAVAAKKLIDNDTTEATNDTSIKDPQPTNIQNNTDEYWANQRENLKNKISTSTKSKQESNTETNNQLSLYDLYWADQCKKLKNKINANVEIADSITTAHKSKNTHKQTKKRKNSISNSTIDPIKEANERNQIISKASEYNKEFYKRNKDTHKQTKKRKNSIFNSTTIDPIKEANERNQIISKASEYNKEFYKRNCYNNIKSVINNPYIDIVNTDKMRSERLQSYLNLFIDIAGYTITEFETRLDLPASSISNLLNNRTKLSVIQYYALGAFLIGPGNLSNKCLICIEDMYSFIYTLVEYPENYSSLDINKISSLLEILADITKNPTVSSKNDAIEITTELRNIIHQL